MDKGPCIWHLPSPPRRWNRGYDGSRNAASQSRAEYGGTSAAKVSTSATRPVTLSNLPHRERGPSIRARPMRVNRAFELRYFSIVLFAGVLIVPAIITVDDCLHAQQKEDFASLETEATRALRPATELFDERADLVARLRAGSERAPDANQRARLALLWLRTMRSLLIAISSVEWNEPLYRNWLD